MSECLTTTNVKVSFGESDHPLKNGYVVRYRKVNSEDPYTEVRVTSLPFIIENAPACYGLEIVVQADCGIFGVGKPLVSKTEYFVRITSHVTEESIAHNCGSTIYRRGSDRTVFIADFFKDPFGTISLPAKNLDLIVNVDGIDKRILCNGSSVEVGFMNTTYKPWMSCNHISVSTGGFVFLKSGNNYQQIE